VDFPLQQEPGRGRILVLISLAMQRHGLAQVGFKFLEGLPSSETPGHLDDFGSAGDLAVLTSGNNDGVAHRGASFHFFEPASRAIALCQPQQSGRACRIGRERMARRACMILECPVSLHVRRCAR
jgi:hypothetical protein